MRAVVLAGGKGTRLSPYTKILPKPLMPIGEMPILEVILLQMKEEGITDITLTVGHLSHLLMAFFQDGSSMGVQIGYSLENKPLGTAGPISQVSGLDSTFLVMNGDILTKLRFRELVKFHHEQKAIATIAAHHRQNRVDLGVIIKNGDCRIADYIEKPVNDYLVSMGIYVFEPEVLQYIPPCEYLDFPDLVKILLRAGEKVVGYEYDGYWQDLGRPDDYEMATRDFETMREEFLPLEAA
jgi:NDP-mannose synthase